MVYPGAAVEHIVELKLYLLGVAPIGYVIMLGWLVAGRPWPPKPAAATPELGPEPPALVAMMHNGWRVDATAAVATLLDLAARRYLEMDQVGGETVVRLRTPPPGRLAPWEREVLDWVRGRAVTGWGIRLAALQTIDAPEAAEFARLVRAEARARGLSTRKPREMVEFSITLFAMSSAGTVALLFARLVVPDWRWWLVGPASFVVVFMLLLLPTTAPIALRDWSTPDGRAALSRWLGVKAYLDATPQLDALPPAAVTVWGRYLAYAAALGSAAVASRTLATPVRAVAVADPPPVSEPDLRLGGISVYGEQVLTPVGSLRAAEARWEVSRTGSLKIRVDGQLIVFVLALMCLFPLNLLYLVFAVERRDVGTVEITVTGRTLRYTTRIPYDGDEQYTAITQKIATARAASSTES
jgi:hypothetical protein